MGTLLSKYNAISPFKKNYDVRPDFIRISQFITCEQKPRQLQIQGKAVLDHITVITSMHWMIAYKIQGYNFDLLFL